MSTQDAYYVPHKATWPVIGTAGLFCMLAGFANFLNGSSTGVFWMFTGLLIFIIMLVGWFTLQSRESEAGTFNGQVGTSYRIGMMWFIFSEIAFFCVFFGTLWYTRNLSVPWLGTGTTKEFLHPLFDGTWPTNGPEKWGQFVAPDDPTKLGTHTEADFEPMGAWGLPFINTLLLLSSGVTCTWAHHALIKQNREKLIQWLIATVALGFIFVLCQAVEYHEAYAEGLTLGTGIYGSTFFMLTGFHGFHVCVGAIILSVVLFRSWKGHFTPDNHFAFEAAAWYWHFVDVVWLGLFIFVYLM